RNLGTAVSIRVSELDHRRLRTSSPPSHDHHPLIPRQQLHAGQHRTLKALDEGHQSDMRDRPAIRRGCYRISLRSSGLRSSCESKRPAQPHTRAQKLLRIDGVAIDARLVVQMRSGGAAGRADAADDLADLDALPDLDIDLRQVAVAGRKAV